MLRSGKEGEEVMKLTEQERAQLAEDIAAMELGTLKVMAFLAALEMGKAVTANAVGIVKAITGENLGSLAEIRAILEIPLESRKQ
ncbi:hypothetical protein KSF_095570 [Reticulibacter mediterranei]|uniref:Uncharacterized protein n=1 Tax=Reticulibacter mediterranei TaxID=2778369 RepID=A0A8J3IPG7_9CHLR|nr:hypothetical protein [Reticulibacter mediterranei]GHO99509.1 hypothetical protein KSF_095570 [Reticulibacter mediterranei]